MEIAGDKQDKQGYTLLERFLFPGIGLNIGRLRSVTHNKTILITGGSFGIGEAIAYQLAHKSVHLVLVARTIEKLNAVGQRCVQLGATVTKLQCDISRPDQVTALVDQLQKLPGGIDYLINNAGKSLCRSIFDSFDRYHDFTRLMNVNYQGPVQLLLSLAPMLIRNKAQIINISAINVLLPPAPMWASYQASKTSFDQFLRCCTPEFAIAGVTVSTIYLPLVRTRMIAPTAAYDKMPAMSPEHVARIVGNIMYSKTISYRPWWLFFVTLSAAIFPALGRKLIAAHYKRSNIHVADPEKTV